VWSIAPWQNQQDLYTWQDDFSYVKGKHTIKVAACTRAITRRNRAMANSELSAGLSA